MSTEEVFAQQFAKLFIHYREVLTVNQDSKTSTQMLEWNEVPSVERERMVAAARLALREIEDRSAIETDHNRYFAKPGEAEWGC